MTGPGGQRFSEFDTVKTVQDRPRLWALALILTILFEAIAVACRLFWTTADEFNPTAPLLLQIHHMFWALPLLVVALPLRHTPAARWLLAVAIGLIASDVLHHLVVLPLWIGHTGWHWP